MLSVNLPGYTIDGKAILQPLSFSLAKGESLTILGANGAGKSTLAKILCGLYRTKGAVRLDGVPLEEYPPIDRSAKINYIPPALHIYERFITVEDFLRLSRFRQTPAEKRVHEVLHYFGLAHFLHSYCDALSSGEQQLLLTASALMHGAEITIFDEPTANLDPRKIKKVFSILKGTQLAQKIVITHDLQFAWKLGYPILCLDGGKAIFSGSAEYFFAPENLEQIYGGSVMKNGDVVTVAL